MGIKPLLLLTTACMLAASGAAYAACPATPVAQATSGYGANGTYGSSSVSFNNPAKLTQKVYVFYAPGAGARPTVMYSHPFGGTDPDYNGAMIAHLNSLGYTVVYPQYPTLGAADAKYDVLWRGFKEAVARYPQYIDKTRVMFAGHSFGGGATPRMTLNGLAEGWGGNGVAMYMMAPWYSLRLSDTDLANFNPNVKMNTVVFRDDDTNDHEMAVEVFEHIGIPDANKAYLRVYSDTESGCTLVADHGAPSSRVELDGLDYWNWYHMDALLDYTFTGNATAWNIALGNGSLPQTYWGTWWTGSEYERAKVFADPLPSQTSGAYQFPCNSADNPRSAHCDWPVADPN